jgi:hypothetical protein
MFTMDEQIDSRASRGGRLRLAPALLVMALAAVGVARLAGPAPLDAAALDDLYASPLPPPTGPMRVYHLGHSLVGRDMPAMLAQLAGPGHRYESQLGWGATLKAHWGDAAIAGHGTENAHPRFRPAAEAIDSGDYDAVVLTEMVEIRDAIRYHDSPAYLRRWAGRAFAARPEIRVFLYETWHGTDDAEGWLTRLDRDLGRYWEGELLAGAQAGGDLPQAIHVIPAGQVMARFARAVAERGGVEGVADAGDLFADTIHLDDLGAYLVALTHYAVLYQQSPVGLPHRLLRADGTPAEAPPAATARLMQEVVWQVVTAYPKTGVPQASATGGAADG